MRYTDGSRELYDMQSDAGEFTNLAGNPDYTDQMEQLNTGLKQRLANAGIKDKSPRSKKIQKTQPKP